MKIVYKCENCGDTSELSSWIFSCVFCGKEICENCMFGYATCHDCASNRTIEEIKNTFDTTR